jgi:hypothetical protein
VLSRGGKVVPHSSFPNLLCSSLRHTSTRQQPDRRVLVCLFCYVLSSSILEILDLPLRCVSAFTREEVTFSPVSLRDCTNPSFVPSSKKTQGKGFPT